MIAIENGSVCKSKAEIIVGRYTLTRNFNDYQ